MDDAEERKARELVAHCRYCGLPDYRPKCKQDYEDSVRDIAAALREKDAEITRLNEAVAYAARLDNAQEDEIAALKVEREELKQTYDKTVERLERELAAARAATTIKISHVERPP